MASKFKRAPQHQKEENVNNQNVMITILRQARKSGVLNLSNRALGKIPDNVWLLHQEIPGGGRTLSMDDAGDSWWDQVDLTKLILASNSLLEISENISNFPALTHLDLHDNKLESLPIAVGGLKELARLNISQNSLKDFPSCILLLENLKCIHIQKNKIKNVPEALGDLYHLEELDISENEITNLPVSINNLTKILTLRASQNMLEAVPPGIGNLKALRSLDLRENHICQLPDEIGELRHLNILYLQINHLSKFPNLKHCLSLKELYLGKNCLDDLSGENIQPLISLVTLDLRENRIRVLPGEISNLQSLERLDLTSNDLSNVPNILGAMTNLKSLLIDGNPIRSIRRDTILKGTSELKKYLVSRMLPLELSSSSVPPLGDLSTGNCNNDTTIKKGVIDEVTLKSTKSLDLSNKRIPGDPIELFSTAMRCGVTRVNCCKNMLTCIPSGLLVLSSSLVELDLSFNQINSLHPYIGQLDKLMFLGLSNNLLSDLPEELTNLKLLRDINLSMNRFEKLPEVLYELKELETIFIADNKVENFDAIKLHGLPKLSMLDLQNNNISYLDPMLGKCTQLRHCKLEGNQFRNPRSAILSKGTSVLLEYLRDRIAE